MSSTAVRYVAAAAAIAALAGCGAADATDGAAVDLERIERQSTGPVWWLGREFEGLRLTRGEGAPPAAIAPASTERAPGAPRPPRAETPGPFFVYGECNGEGDGDSFHCTGPQVQLQHWPIASPDRYPADFSCTRTTVRGVPAAQFDAFEIYVGRALVRISAANHAQARRAAAALRPLDGSASASEPLPAPAIDVSGALRRCALDSLPAKLEELRANAAIPLLWAGRRFEDAALFRAEGDGRSARFFYGGCATPETAGSCYPALTVEVSPVADRRPADWRAVRSGAVACRRLRIGDAYGASIPSAGELYVFTSRVTVVLRGPDHRALRRAADRLHPFAGPSVSSGLAPPPDDVGGELRRVCPVPAG